jgi:hypothetical protein
MHMLMHMTLSKRVQVLMEPHEAELLEGVAVDQGVSVADLLRQAARERYLTDAGAKQAAVEAISALGLPIAATWRDVATASRRSG